MGGGGLDIPGPGTAPDERAVAFAAELIDRSGAAPAIEAALAHRTGRPRPLPARAVLTALLLRRTDPPQVDDPRDHTAQAVDDVAVVL